ncbi:MAG: hypothetical protein KF805_02810 [Phycisphaeraceae bacterium]|nr:hypothetical protein [Phycisphaeraceae bacterium]
MLPFGAAIVLAVVSCVVHAVLAPELARAIAAVLLGGLGGVYLGGALHGGGWPSIVVAAVAAVICVGLGAAGLRGPEWLLAVGFLLHAVWDWVHHALERRWVGPWWPPFCAVFDLIFGVYLLVR